MITWMEETYKQADGIWVVCTMAMENNQVLYVRSDMYTETYLLQCSTEEVLSAHRLRMQSIMLEMTSNGS